MYGVLIRIASLLVPKAKKWIAGRKNIWNTLAANATDHGQPIWVHCASLGEFEQGRPVIESIKREFPQHRIILTFFSPSGYEIRKDYPHADLVCYLPLDTRSNARHFIKLISPQMALFIKYDFWFNYLDELSEQEIPFFFISSVFRENHFLFRKWASPLLDIVKNATRIFVQDRTSRDLLSFHNCPVILTGDTRIDRVIQLQSELKQYPVLQKLLQQKPVLVFGSIWPKDLEIIEEWINQNREKYFFILAPHEVGTSLQKKIQSQLQGRYRLLTESGPVYGDENGVIVNTIGDLAHLYQYGSLAYIGGGFGKGIHSILEPVAAGLPVIFGPNYEKFHEASTLLHEGGALTVKSKDQFAEAMQTLIDSQENQKAKKAIKQFLSQHQGATSKVVQYLVSQKILK